MSLDVIQPKDVPRGRIFEYKDEDLSLKTADIERCQPYYHHKRYLEKPVLTVGNTDPEHVGGRARTYYPEMDRRPRDLSLTTADIEYAQPKSVKARGNRHTDPLQPSYELPSCNVRPATPPRWNGRVTNDVSDIELCQPKKLIPDRNYTRDPNDASDIEYACPNYKRRVIRPVNPENYSTSLNVKDITEMKRTEPRDTNPLEPVYVVPTTTTTSLPTMWMEERGIEKVAAPPVEAHTIGPVAGSKPRKLQWDNGEPQFSLLREDIAGAAPQRWAGAVPFNIYDPPDVKPAISFHDPHDIPGAQVGTLKKGIEGSIRTRNPLDPLCPDYQLLDGSKRPAPTPVPAGGVEAERGHPTLRRAAANTMSLPNLQQATQQRTRPFDTAHAMPVAGTPCGSSGRRSLASNRSQGSQNFGPGQAQRREMPAAGARQVQSTPDICAVQRAPSPASSVASRGLRPVPVDQTQQGHGKPSFRVGMPPPMPEQAPQNYAVDNRTQYAPMQNRQPTPMMDHTRPPPAQAYDYNQSPQEMPGGY